MPEARIYSVLFLCTGNSARSIIAEAILNRIGAGRFRAFSAGSRPKGEVNPFAVEVLLEHGEKVDGARSKSWDEFARPGASPLDFIITVCGNAAREECPAWPGQPVTANWGIDDPAGIEGGDADKRRAFRRAYGELLTRVRLFASLRVDLLDHLALEREVRKIAETRTPRE